ncbi:MAG: SEL1-like repeat protein [Eggerthellaceae bacterium]|nr:SEL1-like repeat protein [Eggerthellaceae bacterium]
MRKSDTTLRELKLDDGVFEFLLEKPLGARAAAAADGPSIGVFPGDRHALASDGFSTAASLYSARCISHDHRDLRHCVVKVVCDRELAHNEWDHLTNMRSSVFPTAFLMGRVEDSSQRFVIVMEFVQGETLSSLIARGFGDDAGPAPVEKALEIMSPLAAAFRDLALSLHPFVHRDVKPDNIIVGEQHGRRRTRLIDLGVSSHVGDPRQREHLGYSAGFAAPEIACADEYPAGETFSVDDARIDTYGLAATLYALVCGYPPAAGCVLDVAALRHDANTIAEVKRAALQSIREKHGVSPASEQLDGFVAQAVSAQDAAFANAVQSGLCYLQSQRPAPLEFFELLPTNYRASLVNDVHLLFLESLAQSVLATPQPLNTVHLSESESVDLQGTALDDGYRYSGFHQDFHDAMAAYNAGNYTEAVPLLMKLDEAGDPTSSYNLGVCYKDGLGGLERDDLKKLACWTRAAEGGHVVAVFNVGVCHEEGLGVPRTPEMRSAALRWYERAAEMGFPAAEGRAAALRAQLA